MRRYSLRIISRVIDRGKGRVGPRDPFLDRLNEAVDRATGTRLCTCFFLHFSDISRVAAIPTFLSRASALLLMDFLMKEIRMFQSAVFGGFYDIPPLDYLNRSYIVSNPICFFC